MESFSAVQRERSEGSKGPRSIWTIGGGKGGSGKTFIAVNLGICLSRFSEEVVLIDTDLGGANIHTLLGLSFPKRTLSDFINKRVEGIRDVVMDTEIPNLGLVVGAQDLQCGKSKGTTKVEADSAYQFLGRQLYHTGSGSWELLQFQTDLYPIKVH